MKLHLFVILLLFSTSACKQNRSTKKSMPNNRLLSFHAKLVFDADDVPKIGTDTLRKLESDDLNPNTDTVKYLNGRIYISFLRVTSGCANYKGDLVFKKDTLVPTVNSDTVCSEQNIYRFTFLVKDLNNQKYFIKKY
jgi:hypothetical protein